MITKFEKFLMSGLLISLIVGFSFDVSAHDRWLISPKTVVKQGQIIPIEFCVGHGFESEAAPSEWWLTKFYVLDPDEQLNELTFLYEKEKQKSAYGKFRADKEGTYMIYSKAERIFWVKTVDGKYIQFKDMIEIEKPLIRRTYVGWQYSKTFIKAGRAKGKAFQKIVGGLIELVPLKDPTTLKVGDSLPVEILSEGKQTNWNIGVIALYKGFQGDMWSYSFYSEFPGELYAKEGVGKRSLFKIPITNKGYWFVKAFRMMDKEILCEGKYGYHDAYFFEATITFYVH